MENGGKTRSLRMSLIEISIMIAVFAVISVFLLQMYVAADSLQGTSVHISKAMVHAESVAETLKGSGSFEDAISTLGMQKTQDELSYVLQYDKQWNPVSEDGSFLIIVDAALEEGSSGMMLNANVKAIKEDGTELCYFPVKRYYPS